MVALSDAWMVVTMGHRSETTKAVMSDALLGWPMGGTKVCVSEMM